jgi:hypothetical protein
LQEEQLGKLGLDAGIAKCMAVPALDIVFVASNTSEPLQGVTNLRSTDSIM